MAQIANPSIFSEMKSINPAVVGGRKQGQITVLGTHDELIRKQDISEGFGEGSTVDSNTQFQQYSFFRGGKGGGLTTEYNIKMVNGVVKNKLKTISDDVESKSNASSMYGGLLIGISDSFGLGLSYSSYSRKIADKFSFGGQSINIDSSYDFTFISVKPGIRYGSNALRFGLFTEYIKQGGESKTIDPDSGPVTTKLSDSLIVAGIGIGMNVGGFNIELGYESFPLMKTKTPSNPPPGYTEPPKPSRISFMIEGKVFKFTLGYKGTLNSGAFIDLENILASQLLYPNPPDSRMEHTVNFAIGSDKGLAIGGSAYVSSSTSKEGNVVFNDGKQNPTTTDAMGLSVKLGYVW